MKEIKKKNKTTESFQWGKIFNAVQKSAKRVDIELQEIELQELKKLVQNSLDSKLTPNIIEVETMHSIVESALEKVNTSVSKSYKDYRNYKTSFINTWETIYQKSKNVLYLGDKENANFNSTLNSTKGSLIRGYLTKELYETFELSTDEKQAIHDGFIYIHDLRDLIFGGINCQLCDIKNVLDGGFEMSNIKYKEPKSVLSALQVIGDITLVATAQQFGGFSLPDIDKVLVKYVEKTIKFYSDEAQEFGIKDQVKYIHDKTHRELRQGLQSLEMKLNTVPCSRGDTAFTTISFGNVDGSVDVDLQRMICEEILNVRMSGQGSGSPVVFPKLVYLYSEEQHKDPDQMEIFNKAIECTSKTMYPDYLSLDAGFVGDIFKSTGEVITPMGCRAFLSDYVDPETNKHIFTGRANIGAASLNLPMIYKKSNGKTFYEDLDVYLEMIREFLKKRYDRVANSKCSTNPISFTQGGLYKGNKLPDDKIGYDIVKAFTSSFGITALNELNVLHEGKPLHMSDMVWVNEVLDYIFDKVQEYKAHDGYLYALYGTPAESLAGTQLQQFRKKYGIIEGVSDKEYFTNSFHCHVSADITPFEKQDMEHKLFHKINGGHIQYVRIENRNNTQAIKDVVIRGMRKGFYQGINFDLVTCEDCGAQPNDKYIQECPKCKSRNITVIERTCGYAGYFRLNGETRFNEAKYAEIQDRKSM